MNVAWIGLGAMGRPMAANLARDHDTTVWNRTAEVARAHAREHGTTAAEELSEVAAAEVIFSCLPTTAEVAEVVDRLEPELGVGTVWVDCTSGDPAPSRELAERLAARGVQYLDAPVSGGTDGAEAGTLTTMVGGDAGALERARPALESVTARVVHVGPVGAGHAVKAVNNTLLAVNLWAAGEGLAALRKHGVDAITALQVVNTSSGRSNATETLIPQRVVTREFPATFTLRLIAKDVGVAMRVLDGAGTPAPVLRAIHELFRAALSELGGEVDHTAALKLIERWAGTEIR